VRKSLFFPLLVMMTTLTLMMMTLLLIGGGLEGRPAPGKSRGTEGGGVWCSDGSAAGKREEQGIENLVRQFRARLVGVCVCVCVCVCMCARATVRDIK